MCACSSDYNKKTESAGKDFYSGNFNASSDFYRRMLQSPGRSRLLYLMELGVSLHSEGKYEDSNRVLLEAARYAETIGVSISKEGESLLLNESSLEYKGEDFEVILIHMYIGLNFLLLNNMDSARVEFNRIALKLKDIRRENGAAFKHNIMAKYLSAVCYEAIGDRDRDRSAHEFAYLECRQIYRLAPKTPNIRQDLVRLAHKLGDTEGIEEYKKFGIEYYPFSKSGDLLVIHQQGRGPYKKSRGNLMNDEGMKVLIIVSLNSMSLAEGVTIAGILVALNNVENPVPDYAVMQNRVEKIDVSVNGSPYGSTGTLEDIAVTAKLSADEKYSSLKSKVAAGIAVKAAAAVASGLAAKKITENTRLKDASEIIGYVTGVTVGTALVSQIKPDLRCWHTLPSSLQILRMRLPAGEHEIDLASRGSNGETILTEKRKVVVSPSNLTVVNVRSL